MFSKRSAASRIADCFIIEQKLKEILDIPVFHDDQHGTAIITTAALINALDISGKSIKEIKIVVNGAGASAQACTELFKNSGVKSENIIMLDRKGVIYKGRTGGIDQWKSRYANETKLKLPKNTERRKIAMIMDFIFLGAWV